MVIETKYHLNTQEQQEYYDEVNHYLREPIRLPPNGSFSGVNLVGLEPRDVRGTVLQSFAETLALDFPHINTLQSVRLKNEDYQILQATHNFNIIIGGIWIPVDYKLPLNLGDGSRVYSDVEKVVIKPFSKLTVADFEGANLQKSEFKKNFKERNGFNPTDSYPYTVVTLA